MDRRYLAILFLAAAGPGSAAESPRPSLLLITIDTLRPDHLGAYGYPGARTPHLDRLGASGIVYENAFTHSPVTLSSHATLFTGRLPTEHGVRSNSLYRLPEKEVTLAEVLKGAGYGTAAFVSAAALDHRFGLSQGFDLYDDEVSPPGAGQLIAERDASAAAAKAIAWLRETASSPFFLWVHFFDPHHPYSPPEPFRSAFSASPYDGEIAFCDEQIGKLLAVLEASGRRGETVILVASDHGEGLGEHGEQTHGIFVYDSTLRVALILSGPGVPKGVREERGPAGLVDVFPTVLAHLGLAVPERISGKDLLGGEPGDLLYAETYLPRDFYNWSELRAVRSERIKFIEAPVRELYDLGSDPGEARNLASERPETVRQLASKLAAMGGDSAGEESAFEPDAGLLAQLQSLGYLGGGPPRVVSGPSHLDRPDPKARIGLVSELDRAIGFFNSRDFAGAGKVLREILAADPENFLAIHYLAESLWELSREKEAIEAYRLAIRSGRDAPYYRYRLGQLHEKLGEFERAAEELGRAAGMNAEVAVEILKRSQALVERGSIDGALAYLETLKKMGSGGVALDLALADVWNRKGLRERALAAIEEGLKRSPGEARLLAARGTLLAEAGRADEALDSLEKALSGLSEPAEKLRVLKAMATLHGQRGDLEEAALYFERALVLEPSDFEALANLALTRIRAGRSDEALPPLGRALELRPEEVRLLNLKAEIHYRRGELEASRNLLRRSLAVQPDQPRIAEALAEVEARLKVR